MITIMIELDEATGHVHGSACFPKGVAPSKTEQDFASALQEWAFDYLNKKFGTTSYTLIQKDVKNDQPRTN